MYIFVNNRINMYICVNNVSVKKNYIWEKNQKRRGKKKIVGLPKCG